MASKPIPLYSPILGPRGERIRNVYTVGRANHLYDAARHSTDRPRTPDLARDWKNNLNGFGHRQLMSAGRFLYANCSQLKRAINLIADLAIGQAFAPQYYGPNKEWGNKAENLLLEWHKIMDVRGGPWNWVRLLKTWTKEVIRSGDVGILFTQNASGYPLVQTIPAHRIGSNRLGASDIVQEGRFKGFQTCNGVILDGVGRALAYQIYDDSGNWLADIGAVNLVDEGGVLVQRADMFLVYDPDWVDQSRGVSRIASGINDWADDKQVREFLKLALKKEASYAVVEWTESGEADPQDEFNATGNAANGQPAEIFQQRTDGAAVQVYRSESGSKVEFPGGNRPSAEFSKFWTEIVRSGFASLDMPMEVFDTMDKGGAALRLILDIAARTIQNTRTLNEEVATRIDSWRLAKGEKRGELEQEETWWQVEHQGPPEVTADKGYSAQIRRDNYIIGFTTKKQVCGEAGDYWEDVHKQLEVESRDIIRRAKTIAEEEGVDFAFAYNSLQQKGANPMQLSNGGGKTGDDGDDPERRELGEGGNEEQDQDLKASIDAYGVAVRAGVVTPTLDDENHIRAKLGLPAITEDVRAAWQRDEGTRRPITLTMPGGGRAAPGQSSQEDEEEE